MTIHIQQGAIHLIDLETRMPFKYGIATMTHTPHAFVRLDMSVAGTHTAGIAADHLPPKWFTKDPDRPASEEVDEMARVIEHAVDCARDVRADCVFDAWRQVSEQQQQWGQGEGLPPLLSQFGTTLVERALIEALCRVHNRPFAELLKENTFGIRLGEIYPELEGQAPRDYLTAAPLEQIVARHTVGLADPLHDADIAEDARLQDGLPQSLEACIRTYGLRHFKIKVVGNLDRDRERIQRIAQLLGSCAPTDYAFSFDGNEQFRSAQDFRGYWESITADPSLQDFFTHLRFVEQPFHRDIALDPTAVGSLREWTARPPLIIDESDGELRTLAQALQLGYVGTSHKNCKGVFKSIANACLLKHLAASTPDQPYLLSGEDLANIGPVALLQDLAVCAALGISSVERNGHHYFAGLSRFPTQVQEQMLQHHPDLYHQSAGDWPTLTIRDGTLAVSSLNRAPFGVHPVIDVTAFPTLAAWRHARQQNTP